MNCTIWIKNTCVKVCLPSGEMMVSECHTKEKAEEAFERTLKIMEKYGTVMKL